jgi:hypothetical protein
MCRENGGGNLLLQTFQAHPLSHSRSTTGRLSFPSRAFQTQNQSRWQPALAWLR